jgi:hypothetical protein
MILEPWNVKPGDSTWLQIAPAVSRSLLGALAVVKKTSFSKVDSGINGEIDIGSSSPFIDSVTRLKTSSNLSR